MEIINHIRRWNKWRKHNLNGTFYKFLVLIGIRKSPTLPLIWLDSELKAYRKDLEDVLYGEPNFLSKHEGKWVEKNDNAVEVLTKQR